MYLVMNPSNRLCDSDLKIGVFEGENLLVPWDLAVEFDSEAYFRAIQGLITSVIRGCQVERTVAKA